MVVTQRPEGDFQFPHRSTIRGTGGLPRTSLWSPEDDVLRGALRGHGWHSTKELHSSAHLVSGKQDLVCSSKMGRLYSKQCVLSKTTQHAHAAYMRQRQKFHGWFSPVSPQPVKLASSFGYADNLG